MAGEGNGDGRWIGGRRKVCDLESFFYMQLSGFAVGIQPAIIIDPISDIRVLLHFCQQDPRADGMKGSGGDEEYISFFDRHFLNHF